MNILEKCTEVIFVNEVILVYFYNVFIREINIII